MGKSQNDSVDSQEKSHQQEQTKETLPISTEDSNESTDVVPRKKAGRPKGSKNKMTLLRELMEEGTFTEVEKNWKKVVQATITAAKKGDSTALKILWDRVVPATKATDPTKSKGSSGITIVVSGMDKPSINATVDGEFEEVEDEDDA